MTEIQFYSPGPVFGTDDVAADGQFDTLVFHLAYILPAGSHAGDTGYGHLEQNVRGVFVVIVEREAETFAEHGSIQTDTGSIGLFPSQVFITDLANQCGRYSVVAG